MSNVQVYMKVSADGSEIAGSSEDKKNHDGWCDVLSYDYTVSKGESPTTASMRGGRSVGTEFVVIKPTDKASPLLMQALCHNQTIEVEIQCWRDKQGGGGRENFFTWKLNQARLTTFETFTPQGGEADQKNPYQEKLGFVAAEVIAVHNDGGIEFQHQFTDADA
jgi:type VI secretion system secreted protein Hcp